jgi:class 3 adenylate cyclase
MNDPMTTPSFKRKLSAILMADVVGYSRLMGEDEAATLKILTTYQGIMTELIRQHRGRVVDSPGDAVLAEFSSVVDAVQCAVAVQKELQVRNAELPEDSRMEFRIGINLGDVIEEKEKIYGDGVNIAARLEALAEPGGICVSKTAFDHIETKLPLGYEFLGEKTVKNIAKPVGAYRVLLDPRVTVAGKIDKEKTQPGWTMKAVIAAGLVMLVAAISLVIWKSGWFSLRPAKKDAPPSLKSPPPPTQVSPPPQAGGISNFFKKFDWNRDGKVALDEFMVKQVKRFNLLDANKDGTISRSELSANTNRFAQKLGKKFDRVDSNQDQMLSRKEFREAFRRQFLKLDSNRDRNVTKDELANVSQHYTNR